MARESKTKRHAKRFGKPDRLADQVVAASPKQWLLTPFIDWHVRRGGESAIKETEQSIELIRGLVEQATHIDASNTTAFYFEAPKCDWNYKEDFPTPVPPYPLMFVESRTPRQIFVDGDSLVSTEGMPELFGWLIETKDAESCGHSFSFPPSIKDCFPGGHPAIGVMEDARWLSRAALVMGKAGSPIYTGLIVLMALGRSGELLFDPIVLTVNTESLHIPGFTREEVERSLVIPWLPPLMLALSILNWKGVVTKQTQANLVLDHERRRAKLKPFVRYHIIEIEPVTHVLRTIGGMSTSGLKRALHVCRGHFATYSTSMLGRTLEKPVTVWRPAHVRGSAKQGIVVSDYNVKAPEEPRP